MTRQVVTSRTVTLDAQRYCLREPHDDHHFFLLPQRRSVAADEREPSFGQPLIELSVGLLELSAHAFGLGGRGVKRRRDARSKLVASGLGEPGRGIYRDARGGDARFGAETRGGGADAFELELATKLIRACVELRSLQQGALAPRRAGRQA
jgi:hypothetical protein